MGHGEASVGTVGVKEGEAEFRCPVKVGGRSRNLVIFEPSKGV